MRKAINDEIKNVFVDGNSTYDFKFEGAVEANIFSFFTRVIEQQIFLAQQTELDSDGDLEVRKASNA
ncbi:11795_t:CDS:2 [Funneliformis geosporum]|uniref:11795_t:CDS:1 n=1 Tax=Funneliformis geosporum TaxID=1117311 RepID=A0A9W4SUN1_9GLOM|nr:11795_t:CDS:2 [Funneliformis geosporum]